MAGYKPYGLSGTVDVDIVSSGTLDVDIKTLGGSLVPAGPLPVDVESFTPGGTQDVEVVSWEAGTLDVDIKTLGGSLVPAGPLPVDVMSGIFAGTQDVDIKTIGGSLIPSGNLPVDATQSGAWTVGISGTVDTDLKTLGGSVVPAGPLPVDVSSWSPTGTQDVEVVSWEAGTIDVDIVSSGTLDVDIKTIGGSLIPSGNLPVDATQSGAWTVGISGTIDTDLKTLGGSVVPSGPLPVSAAQSGNWTSRIYGYDGANWDELRTTESMAGGTIDTGLLAVGRVPPADPVEKIASFTDAASTVAVWTPAGGKRWNLTDFVISAKNACDVTLYVGNTSTKAIFYFADNGGVVMDLQTPFVATGTNTPLRISLTSATLSITTGGYETS